MYNIPIIGQKILILLIIIGFIYAMIKIILRKDKDKSI